MGIVVLVFYNIKQEANMITREYLVSQIILVKLMEKIMEIFVMEYG